MQARSQERQNRSSPDEEVGLDPFSFEEVRLSATDYNSYTSVLNLAAFPLRLLVQYAFRKVNFTGFENWLWARKPKPDFPPLLLLERKSY